MGCGKVCVGCRTERTQNSAPSPFPHSTSTYKVLSGKFSTRSGKFTGHFKCFRESLRQFTAFSSHLRRYREVYDDIGKVYGFFPVI